VILSLDTSPDAKNVNEWFVREVLPFEPALMNFLHRHWPDAAEAADLRQDTYVRIYEAARRKRPDPVKPYLFFVARNLIIDRLRHRNVVPIETMSDAEWLSVSDLEPLSEQRVAGRQELRRMLSVLEELPPRCRQVIMLRRIQALSQREVALKMGISEETVENQIVKGMRAITEAMSDKRGNVVARARRFRHRKGWP
jgi:RNA polymerase sigma-70 factor (ECF subfamily)